VVTVRMPIILQHNGHSRTVIGYEITKSGEMVLLTFDPSRRVKGVIRSAALGDLASPLVEKSTLDSKNFRKQPTTSKIFKNISQPFRTSTHTAKRTYSPGELATSPAKRLRAGDREVIEIDSDGEIASASPVNTMGHNTLFSSSKSKLMLGLGVLTPGDIIKPFRVAQRNLVAKAKYQILWFPLSEPLTDHDRLARQVVTSDKIC